MGRAFEYRKARKLKRWGNMARTFTKLGKEIEIAVKAGGPDPGGNVRLRVLIQNAKAANMPKENVERAIKRAISKDTYGIAIIVETATDNTTRTVANVRNCFNKCGGTLGTTGSVDFLFEHKCVFKVAPKEGVDLDELELELIDFGVDEVYADENEITIYGAFEAYGKIQKYIEDNGFELISGEFVRIPLDTKEVTDEQRESIDKLVERLEEDDDVTNVFHNMKEAEDSDDEEE